jgi:hypothetical protein
MLTGEAVFYLGHEVPPVDIRTDDTNNERSVVVIYADRIQQWNGSLEGTNGRDNWLPVGRAPYRIFEEQYHS